MKIIKNNNPARIEFEADQSKISLYMASQYALINNCDESIKQMFYRHNIGFMEAYEIAKIKGKNKDETFGSQFLAIMKTEKFRIRQFKINEVKMIFGIISANRLYQNNSFEIMLTTNDPATIINEIDKLISKIIPGIELIDYYEMQSNYCDTLIKNTVNFGINMKLTLQLKEEMLEKLNPIKETVNENKRFIHPLLLARKRLNEIITGEIKCQYKYQQEKWIF